MSQPGNSQTANVSQLFQSAQDEGLLSAASMKAFMPMDVGAQIQAAMGVPAMNVTSSEVLLVTNMVDDSGSMTPNVDVVRKSFNGVIEALVGSQQRDSILMHCRYLNGTVLFPYVLIEQAVRMTSNNYGAWGETPLYDQTVVVLGSVLAKTQEFRNEGVACRSATLIMTDGHDQHSRKHRTPESVAPIVSDMLKAESHIIAAMGIDDGSTDFRDIFQRMGIDDKWILTPDNNGSDIRRCLDLFSRSSLQASQGGKSFSQTAQAGIGWTD